MAASTSTAAHSNNNSCFDVFISHRGPDVKKTFASHLYRRLISYGLRVFLDYKELQEGEEFPCQIKDAIKTASVQIAIFSPKYADSQWCLDELLFMLESGAPIIPVFHHVKPTDLRRTDGEGDYARSLRNLEQKRKYDSDQPRYGSKTIENWRTALSRVADISGFDLEEGFNGDEGELLDRLVEVVLKKGKKKLNVARYPTGLDEKVEEFETKLSLHQHSETVQFVGITGLGGSGKTTLAKELFNRKSSSSRYSKSCFLIDVRENAKISIPSLQRKLLKDLTASGEPIDSKDEGLEILRKHFSVLSAPVLLVLDDVDHQDQVHALLPVTDKGILALPPSSLILITTRDKNVLVRSGVQEPSIYMLTGLNTERSRELFCSHAFSQPHPMQGFEDLVNQFLKACNGLPLSLKVFGGLLYGNTNKSYWKNELEELRKALPHDIQKSLQISYDALQPDEKQMFLDIACFFIGKSRDTAITVWKASGWNGSRGFEILLSKCLVELDIIVENPIDMYRIRMHDHLRDMGRYLANNTLGFPRRLWRGTKHRKDLLQQSFEATKVRGIRMLRSEHYCDERADSDKESADSDDDNELASYNMKNLQLLDIDMEEDHLKCLLDGMDSPNLLWFCWRNCPCSSLPPYIPMEKLRVLEVEGGILETLWQEDSQTPFRLRELRISASIIKKIPKSIGQLKHLELMVVRQLKHLELMVVRLRIMSTVQIPKEFCDLRSLKHLVLEIPELRSLPDSFGNLSKLEHINLKRCYAFERLPDSFGDLSSLQRIDLSICGALQNLPDSFGNLSRLQHINLYKCGALERLPDSFGNLSKLEHINLKGCCALERLPDSFGDLSSLQHIDLSYCDALQNLPDSFGNLSKLEHINLEECHALERLPDSFGNLSKLEHINLEECRALERLPDSFGDLSSLQYINLSCRSNLDLEYESTLELEYHGLQYFGLERLPDSFGNLSKLEHIDLTGCCALERLPDSFGDLSSLQRIDLSSCHALQNLPDSFGNLSKLEHIYLGECGDLERLPDSFGNLSKLEHIHLFNCYDLQNLPDSFGNLSKLEHINLEECGDLERLPDSFGNLSKLEHINLSGCCALERLPDSFGNLSKLEHINLRGCCALERLPDSFGDLSSLQHINLSYCGALGRLPDSFGNLIKLKYINLLGCHKLTIPGGTFRKIPLEYMCFPEWRIEVLPPHIAHQWSLEKLQLWLINKEEWSSATGESSHLEKLVLETPHFLEVLPPSFGRDLRNLKYLELRSCQRLERLPDSFLLMDQLTELIVKDCPLQELHFETVEGGSETMTHSGGQGTLSNLERGLLRLHHLELYKTQISEISFPTGVCSNLQYLDIRNCQDLVEVGTLPNALIKLQLIDCPKLRKIERLSGFAKLQTLGVSRCKEVEELPSIKDKSVALAESTGPRELNNSDFSFDNCLLHLQHLILQNTAISEVLYATGVCPNLQYLYIRDCQDMVEVGTLPNALIKLQLTGCPKLRKIALDESRRKEVAELLSVKGKSDILTETTGQRTSGKLDSSFDKCLIRLQHFELDNTEISAVSFPAGVYPNLQYLSIEHGTSLVKFVTSPDYILRKLDLWNCSKLRKIEEISGLAKLQALSIARCGVEDLSSIETLGSLENLQVLRCSKLKSIPVLAKLTKLRELDVSNCSELEDLSGVEHLRSLEKLWACGCKKLKSIRGSAQLTRLRELDVSECSELEELLDIEHLRSLDKFLACNCGRLKHIQGLAQLTQLQELDVSGCSRLEEMPGVGYLQSLPWLRSSECVWSRWLEN